MAPWAGGAAGELWRRFGDQVDLRVGALPYPPGRRPAEGVPPPRGPPGRPARLGYAVPRGDWGVEVTLDFLVDVGAPPGRERVPRRTPVLPLTITA